MLEVGLRQTPTHELEVLVLVFEIVDFVDLIGDFNDISWDWLLIVNCDLRSLCTARASDSNGLLLLKLFWVSLDINDAFSFLFWVACSLARWLSLNDPCAIACAANASAFVETLLRSLDDFIRDSFFHEVNLALSDDLHELILKRNHQLFISLILYSILMATSQPLQSGSAASLSNQLILARLDRRMHQEGIILVRKIEVLAKVRVVKHPGGVCLHFQEIILVFPYKRDVLELLDIVLWRYHPRLGLIVLVCQ